MALLTRRAVATTAMAVASAVLVAAIAFVVWDRNFNQASPASPGMSCPMIVQPKHRPPLTAIGIRRVALVGDSIMNQASCTIAASLANEGIETGRYAVGGSGLLSGPVNWLQATPAILETQRPDAVLAIFVGNYLPPLPPDVESRVADNSPAFFSLWQQRAVQLSNEIRAMGASLYWVSPPPIEPPVLDHAQRLFDGYRTIPGDHVIEAGDILAGANGQEVLYKFTCGRVQLVRTLVDGVHLTDAGARLYGQEIAHQFTAQTGLLASPKPC